MPSYYFDSEDSSVAGEAGRCARHLTFRDLPPPSGNVNETNDLSAHEAALSEIAPSARFTVAYLCYQTGGTTNWDPSAVHWDGYYTPGFTKMAEPDPDSFAPESVCVSNWNSDLAAVEALDTYETNSDNEIGMHQDDLNIMCRGVLWVKAIDASPAPPDPTAENVPLYPASFSEPDLRNKGINLDDDNGGAESTTTQMDAFFTRSFAVGGVRYPDKIVINPSFRLVQGAGGLDYTPARLEAIALLHSSENNQNTHYADDENISTLYGMFLSGEWLKNYLITRGADRWNKTA